MDYSAVIFDCDGVLIDSEPLSAEVTVQVLNDLGVSITADEVCRVFVGKALPEVVAYLKEEHGLDYGEQHQRRTGELMHRAMVERLQPIQGVGALVRSLKVPHAIASNSGPDHLALGLGLTGLYGLFYPHVFSRTLVPRGKPAPDIYLYAARMLDVAPRKAVVIEDSVTGVTAAKAAQMQVIGFGGGSHQQPDYAERLLAAGADHIAGDMNEVARLLHG